MPRRDSAIACETTSWRWGAEKALGASLLGRVLTAAALAATVGACDTIGSWFETEKVPLPGERISVLALETSLEPDESVQDLTVTLPAAVSNADWPQEGGTPEAVMRHLALSGALSRAWSADIGTGSDDEERVTARPVSANGRVYTMDARARVSAFDLRTGERIWQVGLGRRSEDPGEIGGGVAVGDGVIVATTPFGDLYALEPETGNYFWQVRIDGPIRGAPLVSNGRVYFLASDSRLKAHDLETGEEIWVHQGLQETAEQIGTPAPTGSGPFVLAPYASGEIYAIRADTGQAIWSDQLLRARRVTPLGAINDIDAQPVIDEGRVYVVGQGGAAAAIDLQRGIRIWDQEIAGRQTPWLAGDFLYLVSSESELVCLSADDGGIRWVTQMPKFEDPEDNEGRLTWVGPVVAGERVIVANNEGQVAFYSPFDGSPVGGFELDDGIAAAPIVVDGTLLFVTDGGELIAYR